MWIVIGPAWSIIARVLKSVKDATRRLRRSPSAILDRFSPRAILNTAGTEKRALWTNRKTFCSFSATRTRKIRLLHLLYWVGILTSVSAHAALSTWLQEQTANMHRVQGRINNRDYGYSIEAPPSVSQYVTKGGDANHGITVIIGEPREIDIYPEYVNSDLGNIPCAHNPFSWQPSDFKVTYTEKLAGQPACVMTFTHNGIIYRILQSLGNDRGTGILYTLLLETNRQYYESDRRIFQNIVGSFRRIPIYP